MNYPRTRLFVPFLVVLFVSLAALADGFHIHPYLQNITPDGATIFWESADEGLGAVQFGLAGNYDKEAKESQPAKIHHVRLTGLKPDTAYAYKVQAGADEHKAAFKTAPGAPRPITFAVIGDSRRWDDRWQETHMADHMMQWKPEFVINNGDLVLEGHKHDLWPAHFQRFASFNDKIEMLAVRGNHEGSRGIDTDHDWFGKYHEEPGAGEPFFSFDWGNTHLIVVSMDSLEKSIPQLDEDLGKSTAKYKMVMFHPPIYCTGYASARDDRKDTGERMAPIWRVLDKHHVILHLAGHTHIYERSYPLRDGKRDFAGTTYLVNGGDINANYPEWFTAVSDNREANAKPTYTLISCKEDRVDVRTFAWATKENKIDQIDHVILYTDQAIPESLTKELAHKKDTALLDTVEELGAMQYPPAARSLLPYLDSKDAVLREAAAKAIRAAGSPDVAASMAKLVKDPDVLVAREAARAIEVAMPNNLAKSVAKLARDASVDETARVSLIGALQYHAPAPIARETTMAILKGEAPAKVRNRAAYALAHVATKDDVKAIVKLVDKEPEPFAVAALAHKLNQLTGERVPEGEKQPLATAAPGNRKDLTQKWLSGH